MGHRDKSTYRHYAPTVINIDSQSLVRGRETKKQFIAKNQSMMMHRDIHVPQPPGAALAATPSLKKEDEEIVQIRQISDSKRKEMRRQMRKREYAKDRKVFFHKSADAYEVEDPNLETKRSTNSEAPKLERKPSRYLEALLKHEPERATVIRLLYHKENASLAELVPPLQKLSTSGKERTTYRGIPIPSDGKCQHCSKPLQM